MKSFLYESTDDAASVSKSIQNYVDRKYGRTRPDDTHVLGPNQVVTGIRGLGDWEYSHEAHGGDDDHPRFSDSPRNKKIRSEFEQWAAFQDWSKTWKVSIQPEEKGWVSFEAVRIKRK
jgi:hypothetical protein